MSSHVQTPFDSIENAQDYVRLLLETILEARNDVEEDMAVAVTANSERRMEALRVVQFKLEKLEQHLRSSSRALNDLRSLRRLLIDKQV